MSSVEEERSVGAGEGEGMRAEGAAGLRAKAARGEH